MNKKPLMFINSEVTNVNTNSQETFDSRYDKRIPKRKKVEKKAIEKTVLNAIENACTLYEHQMPVLCSIMVDGETKNIIPTSIDNNKLFYLEKEIENEISLDDINDFKIEEV